LILIELLIILLKGKKGFYRNSVIYT